MEKLLQQLPLKNIKKVLPVSGGDVNEAYHLIAEDMEAFLLVQKGRPVDFYMGEIAGLKLFEEHGINAPQVLDYGQVDGDAYLLLSYLKESHPRTQESLGQLVAKLHQVESPNGKYGFPHPYRGSAICFSNDWQENWANLFINERMDQLAQALEERGLWGNGDRREYERVREIMANALAHHKSHPVLLHGDLWAGNFMFVETGEPVLFDPSPLYGDREFDIGITTVFGGFDPSFYQAYQEILPLAPGYEGRLEFYRLYLLMVHLLKFGRSYEPSVRQSISQILTSL